MRLCLALVSLMIIGLAIAGSGCWASAQVAQVAQVTQVNQPTIQISWMQSSARPRWGGGQ